jgi:Lar family restriction alleviation protein
MKTLLPCPFCGGEDLEDDYGALTTSSMGIDYQSGNIGCKSCHAEGPFVSAIGDETDILRDLVIKMWNKRA